MGIILAEAMLVYLIGCLALVPCLSSYFMQQQTQCILLDGVTATIDLSCQTEKLFGSFRSVSLS